MKILLSFILLFVSNFTNAEAINTETVNAEVAKSRTTLTVVTKPFVPFVIPTENNNFEGFSIDLWNLIARELNVDSNIVQVNTITGLLDKVKNGKADVGLAGISMTAEREKELDFSYPFFGSGLQIMVLNKPESSVFSVITDMLRSFLEPKMLLSIGGLLFTLFIVGNIIWLAERKNNPDEFSAQYLKGVMDGLWWAAVTLTTVGYGDKSPRGFSGRLIALLWMFIGLFLIASFTATITATVTSTLTLQKLQGSINSPNDLIGKSVATITGSTANKYLEEKYINLYPMLTIEIALEALKTGEVDAIVYDSPVLRYYAAQNKLFKTVGSIFRKENYAIVFPTGSKLKENINFILLELSENQEYKTLEKKWFGKINSD